MSKLFIPEGCVVEGEIVALSNVGDIDIEAGITFRTLASESGFIRVRQSGNVLVCDELCADQGGVEVVCAELTCARILAASVDLKADRLNVSDSIVTSGKLLVEADEGVVEAMSGQEAELEVGHLTVQSVAVEGEFSVNTDHARLGEIRAARVIIRGTVECQRIVASEAVIVEAGSVSVKYLDSPTFHAAPSVTGIVAVATSEDVRAEGVRGFLHPGELDMLAAVDAPVARVAAFPSAPSPGKEERTTRARVEDEVAAEVKEDEDHADQAEFEDDASLAAESDEDDAYLLGTGALVAAEDDDEEPEADDGDGDDLYGSAEDVDSADEVDGADPAEDVGTGHLTPPIARLRDVNARLAEGTLTYDALDEMDLPLAAFPEDEDDEGDEADEGEDAEASSEEAPEEADEGEDAEASSEEAPEEAEAADEQALAEVHFDVAEPVEDEHGSGAETDAQDIADPEPMEETFDVVDVDGVSEVEVEENVVVEVSADDLVGEKPIEIDTDDLDGADLYMDSDEFSGEDQLVESMDDLDGESLLVQDLNETLNRIRAFFPSDGVPKFIDQIDRYLEEGRFNLFRRINNKRAVLSSFDKYDHDEISRLAREFFDRLEGFAEATE